ncbi:MAG: SigE family RNA polymerase sigma factor [Dermatophilaceae bacterium]
MALKPEQEDDFRRFVEAHWLGLVRSAYLIVGERGAAEDLVQQTLASVYRHWDRRVREGAPVAYVRKSLVNHAISNARRKRVAESLFSGLAHGGRDGSPDGFDIDRHDIDRHDAYRGVDDRDLIVRALRGLPPQMRAVVVLRYFDDLTEAATADLLGISVGSVKSQTSRGLQRLRAAVSLSQSEGTFR